MVNLSHRLQGSKAIAVRTQFGAGMFLIQVWARGSIVEAGLFGIIRWYHCNLVRRARGVRMNQDGSVKRLGPRVAREVVHPTGLEPVTSYSGVINSESTPL